MELPQTYPVQFHRANSRAERQCRAGLLGASKHHFSAEFSVGFLTFSIKTILIIKQHAHAAFTETVHSVFSQFHNFSACSRIQQNATFNMQSHGTGEISGTAQIHRPASPSCKYHSHIWREPSQAQGTGNGWV